MYWFKRKRNQIQRVMDFLPIIWKGYDWDYNYSLDVFKKGLERTATLLESEKACTLSAKTNAQKIRTAIRLMDIVYEEKYLDDFFNSNITDRNEYLKAMDKQKRAHKLLWDFIEHNIQHWWD